MRALARMPGDLRGRLGSPRIRDHRASCAHDRIGAHQLRRINFLEEEIKLEMVPAGVTISFAGAAEAQSRSLRPLLVDSD
jgi:hypothetical protein